MSPLFEVGLIAFVVYFTYNVTTLFLYKREYKRKERKYREIAEKTRKEHEEREKQVKEFEEQRQRKIANMQEKGFEKVRGMLANDYFIECDGDNIVAMYDISGKRIPLAYLGLSREARVVGIDPVIYYDKYKVLPSQIIYDDIEVRSNRDT